MLTLPIELYKLIAFVVIAIMLILRTGGISFFFRLFMRIFSLSYDNHQLKKSESAAYDLQLFKALEGVNVRNISDAKIIRNGINTGVIPRQRLWFTSPIGYIGDSEKSRIFYCKNILILILCLGASLLSHHLTTFYKFGYYRVEAMGQHEYVSLSDITTQDEDRFLGKKTCEYVLSHNLNNSIRSVSCSFFMRAQDDVGYKTWLSKQIDKNNLEYRTFYWGSVFYGFLFIFLSIGLRNFYYTNQLILQLKNEQPNNKKTPPPTLHIS